MELLDEVFIKEVTEAGVDKVFIVRNLPKKFVYFKGPKMVQRVDRDGYSDGILVPDPKGEKVDTLLDGLEKSQNGDGSIMFLMNREPGKFALAAIDAYIRGTVPRDSVLPERVDYPLDKTDPRSAPKTRDLIPVVELPVSRVEPQISPEASPSSAKPTRTLTEEQKAAARERMAKARAVAQAKKEAAKNEQ